MMIRMIRLPDRFSAKIILTIILVILIPTLFISSSFYWASDAVLKKNVRESTVQLAKQTADALSSILNAASDTSDLLYSDLNVQRAVMHMNNSPSDEQSRMFQYLNTMLNNIVYTNSFVKMAYVLKEDGGGWGSGTFSDAKLKRSRLSEQEWVKEAKRRNGELVWTGIQHDRFSGGGFNPDLVLPVGRVLKDFGSMGQIGMVLVQLDGRSILDTIGQLELGKTGKFFVVDAAGHIMIDRDLRLIGRKVDNPDLYENIVGHDRTEFEYAGNGVPHYGVKQALSNGWMLVGTVPANEITGQLNRLQTRMMISSAAFALIAAGIGLLIARRVTGPVRLLARDMTLVGHGDLSVRTKVRAADEIGLLGIRFNRMLDDIVRLMSQVKEEQGQKHDAELRAVMHRIHPHFLFNTLSTLRWLIKSNQNERAYEGLSALTRLLEANMAKSGNRITVEEELEIIRKYLTILEIRYDKTFTLDLMVEPGTEKVMIPRMLLQPLVENAIFHGIVPKRTNGRISIQVGRSGRGVEFLVKDDGLGIEAGKLKELNTPGRDAAGGKMGIGLRHVQDSLRLYGEQSEWNITSVPDQGATVRILLHESAEPSA